MSRAGQIMPKRSQFWWENYLCLLTCAVFWAKGWAQLIGRMGLKDSMLSRFYYAFDFYDPIKIQLLETLSFLGTVSYFQDIKIPTWVFPLIPMTARAHTNTVTHTSVSGQGSGACRKGPGHNRVSLSMDGRISSLASVSLPLSPPSLSLSPLVRAAGRRQSSHQQSPWIISSPLPPPPLSQLNFNPLEVTDSQILLLLPSLNDLPKQQFLFLLCVCVCVPIPEASESLTSIQLVFKDFSQYKKKNRAK